MDAQPPARARLRHLAVLCPALLAASLVVAGCRASSTEGTRSHEQEVLEQSEYAKRLCEAIPTCYAEHGYSGEAAGEVTIELAPSGRVTQVEFSGDAPDAIEQCIVGGIEKKQLDPYNGEPGQAVCKYSGRIADDVKMLNRNFSYEARK